MASLLKRSLTWIEVQLMKLARQKKAIEFLRWLGDQVEASGMPDGDLVRICLIYFLSVNPNRDHETINHTLSRHPQLKNITMTLEQVLINRSIAKGKAEGKAEGTASGMWIGKLQLLQSLMEVPVTPAEDLELLSTQELMTRFHALQGEYDRRFKR